MAFLGRIGHMTETGRISGGGFSFDWRIPDFISLAGGSGDRYDSPDFHACGGQWYFRIHPNGIWTSSGWVSLYLFRWDAGPPKALSVTLGIRGAEGVENERRKSLEFSVDDRACFWYKFCSRSKLEDENSRLMPGNKLVIALDMKSDEPSVVTDSSTQTVLESEEAEVSTEKSQTSEKQGGEKALEDFGKLLDSGEKSDVIIQLGDVEFNVHSFILFARSPALSVSLQHECKEKASNKIVIDDCEPDAFRHFLRYLYTGSVQSLDEQTVFALYSIADKYLAEDLKKLCLEHMQDTLSVQTFCNSMKLALTYNESDLLRTAIDFATKNIGLIKCSVEWQDFIREYPTEANEIFIKYLGLPCNSK